MVLLLHNIRSVQNVASIFRTADGVGVEKIYLCGITPGPLDRLGHSRGQFVKVSLGSEKSIPYDKFDYPLPIALIVGNETTGVSKEVLDMCDAIVELPMSGINKSLNVMVSLGIVLYEVIEKNGMK